ncbi:hypothetical protein [Sphingobacterium sp. IITKGP-BTPF85]|uniref:hypothetical protein n=1 Tax=Sphingobacterium sp. IITKGP-BTPF85 TaxID=1338009 RepID=UPI000389F22C|nr:hypothetical protein [Sphingobacterium sp. IITKGP-BTPF85]KKX47409.1 hypothetical protein L950_0226660 [Sphingobacterium sp. IITKGP-BTPF85]
MKKISIIISILTLFSSIVIGQNSERMILIKDFYQNLYKKNITPEKMVEKYIFYKGTKGHSNAIKSIQQLRDSTSASDDHFLLLRNDILNEDFTVQQYNQFSDIDIAKFSELDDQFKCNIYKVTPKSTIPNFILIQENKIASFFGFQKGENSSYLFLTYQ